MPDVLDEHDDAADGIEGEKSIDCDNKFVSCSVDSKADIQHGYYGYTDEDDGHEDHITYLQNLVVHILYLLVDQR